jgi:hypothetical protein
MRRRTLRLLVLLGLGALLGACLKPGIPAPPPEALVTPVWRVGDRWVFHRTVAGAPVVVVTHEVIEATPEGYVVRITRLNQELIRRWTAELGVAGHDLGGRPLNRFEPAARYFDWPLALGKVWSQSFEYRDGRSDGRYENHWRIGKEPAQVDVPDGRYITLKIERLGGDGRRLEAYWYSPLVRYWVRLEDDQNRYVEQLFEFRAQP